MTHKNLGLPNGQPGDVHSFTKVTHKDLYAPDRGSNKKWLIKTQAAIWACLPYSVVNVQCDQRNSMILQFLPFK